MKRWVALWAALMLGCINAWADQPLPDFSTVLPADGEVAGFTLDGPPERFQGDQLFMMINGGAEIYHEYGFAQVIAANYIGPDRPDQNGAGLRLEIYEMESTEAAFGMFTFKTGDTGTAADIGQEAVFDAYYLNFWKGRFLVTIIGSGDDEKSRQAVLAMARAVDNRIRDTGLRPKLADLAATGPSALSHPKYIKGILGVMNTYVFDTRNVFRVTEGITGMLDGCRAFIFQYADKARCGQVFEKAVERFWAGDRFSGLSRKENLVAMSGRDKESVMIRKSDQYIIVAIGPNSKKDQDQNMAQAMSVLEKLALKLSLQQ